MNDKFKEIADRVGLGTRHNGIVLTKDVDAAEAFEQFAQSIVEECCDAITEADSRERESFFYFRRVITKHFGLK